MEPNRGRTALRETDLEGIDIPVQVHSIAPEEHRLLHVLSVLWRERKVICRLSAYVGIASLIFAILSPNEYRSTTQLMPPDSKSSSGLAALASLASQMGGSPVAGFAGDALGIQSTGALFIGVLRSRTAGENLVKQFNLQAVYGMPKLQLTVSKEDALKQLERNTEISEDRKSGIISIAVTDKNPERAADIAHGYVDQLNHLITTLTTSGAKRERLFLEQRLADVKRDLDEASRELSQFSSKNSTLDPKDQGAAMMSAAASLEGELIAAESQLEGLSQIYSDNNVRVRSLRARIAELKKQLSNISGGGDLDGGSANKSGMPLPSIRQLPLLGATYADLYRRAKIQETVYEVLTQQYEMAKVEEAKEIPTVRVLDAANIPQKKWGPHRAIDTFLGLIVGFLLGCMIVLALHELNRRESSDPYKVFTSQVATHLRGYRVCRQLEHVLRIAITGKRIHSLDE